MDPELYQERLLLCAVDIQLRCKALLSSGVPRIPLEDVLDAVSRWTINPADYERMRDEIFDILAV